MTSRILSRLVFVVPCTISSRMATQRLTSRVLQLNRCVASPTLQLRSNSTEQKGTKESLSSENILKSRSGSQLVFTWKSVLIFAIFGGAIWLIMYQMKNRKLEEVRRNQKLAVGKMAIGGEFDLVDHEGKPRKSQDFRGQWMLIYFGFTHCPDICPEEMEKMCHVVDLIDKVEVNNNNKIVPLFITIDQARDDVKAVAKYVKGFSPKLIGLTGTAEQIEDVAHAYRVYRSKGPADVDNDYIVDHTVIMYLVDPDGKFVDYYGQNKNAEEIATACAIHMLRFKDENKSKK